MRRFVWIVCLLLVAGGADAISHDNATAEDNGTSEPRASEDASAMPWVILGLMVLLLFAIAKFGP